MAGYIGSKASVVSSGAEHKKTFTITGATTSLTGLNYTVGKVHVFQNGVRLVDGTDYTATNGTTITLTVAAQSGDNVVVISQASYQVALSGIDDQSNAVAMTIDSSERVMLGITSPFTNPFSTNDGVTFGGAYTWTQVSDAGGQYVQRQNDGKFFTFFKGTGSSSVGSIGVGNTDNLFIQGNSSHAGIQFGTNSAMPHTNGNTSDNAEDLGTSNTRWKDLYLSGGVYLGGTGSANKLEDYEEGSWTPTSPTVTYTSVSGRYIKVGSAVHLHASITVPSTSSSAHFTISGFPFTQKDTDAAAGFYMRYTTDSNYRMFYLSNGNNISVYSLGGHATPLSSVSTGRYDFSGVYYTDS